MVIGSIDTGVELTHPEFTGRLIAGRDWYNNDTNPTDDEGHGTHTTGTMAGSTVGVAGVSGAAAHVKVYVQKVCGRRGCPTAGDRQRHPRSGGPAGHGRHEPEPRRQQRVAG